MGWADQARTLKVRANADTPADATTARKFGAEGIGLCRTEHMFFDADRIVAVRQMILADAVEGRKAALAKLLPMQRGDFEAMFKVMGACRSRSACSIRRCTNSCRTRKKTSRKWRAPPAAIRRNCAHRAHRAARIQSDARPSRLPARHHLSGNLRDAGARHFRSGAPMCSRRAASPSNSEIMIPLVGFKSELDTLKTRIDAVAAAVRKRTARRCRPI